MESIVCESLKHTKWECKHHVVFIPKYRKKRPYHELRQHLGGRAAGIRPDRRSAGLKKGTWCRTMCTCGWRFRRSMPWRR
jgi:REP element-mobilizing transposase RayT